MRFGEKGGKYNFRVDHDLVGEFAAERR